MSLLLRPFGSLSGLRIHANKHFPTVHQSVHLCGWQPWNPFLVYCCLPAAYPTWPALCSHPFGSGRKPRKNKSITPQMSD